MLVAARDRLAMDDDGRAALDEVLRADPDVIVLDVRMPVMDGIEFMKVIRAYHRFQHVPVVVVTAITDRMQLDRLTSYRIARIFTNASFDLAEFLSCVEQLAGAAPSPWPPPPDPQGTARRQPDHGR